VNDIFSEVHVMKRALITGITGQDGAYLAEFLLDKGYEVHGIKRRSSSFNTYRVDHLYQDPHEEGVRFCMHYGDLTDSTNIIRIIQAVEPDEIYNLGAQSHVQVSFETPEYTAQADAVGTLRILEALRILGMDKKVRFYQASTSELFGKVQKIPQDEDTPFYPRSPYGVAKLYAYWTTINYRESYGMFACNGILFNHESPIRGETFITRKVTRAVSRIALGLQDRLYIGNLDAKRDWGHARDYVVAQWLILQQDKPDDYVIATGRQHSVRDLCSLAFSLADIDVEWVGTGVDEKGVISKLRRVHDGFVLKPGDVVVMIDPRYFRPSEVDTLLGNPAKAKRKLGWEAKISFEEMIEEMVEHDLDEARRDLLCLNSGFQVMSRHE